MCAYGMSVSASAYGCAYAHTCICVKAKGSVMPLCLPLSSCPPPPTLPLLSFTIVLPTCCYLLSFPFSHTYSLSLFFIPPPPCFCLCPPFSSRVSVWVCVFCEQHLKMMARYGQLSGLAASGVGSVPETHSPLFPRDLLSSPAQMGYRSPLVRG